MSSKERLNLDSLWLLFKEARKKIGFKPGIFKPDRCPLCEDVIATKDHYEMKWQFIDYDVYHAPIKYNFHSKCVNSKLDDKK